MIILERFIIEKLKEWKESKYRKPLFLIEYMEKFI
jgi:hypothetical protein